MRRAIVASLIAIQLTGSALAGGSVVAPRAPEQAAKAPEQAAKAPQKKARKAVKPAEAVKPEDAAPAMRGALSNDHSEKPASVGNELRGPLAGAKAGIADQLATGSTMRMRGQIAVPLAPVDGLRGAVDSALVSSFALRASLADQEAAQFGVWRELASFTPLITGSLEHNWADGTATTSDGEMSFAAVQMTLPLFTSGQRLFSVRAASNIARAAQFRTATVRDGVVLQMAEAYMQQVYAVRALEALGRNEAMMSRLLSSMKAQHASGFASGADVAEVNAELDATRQQIADLNVMRQKAREKANSLAGRQVSVRQDFPGLDNALSAGQAALRRSAMRRNPNVLVAQYNAEASKETSRAAVSRHLPQVGLSASYRQVLGDINDGGDRDRWNVGVKMTMPLVDLTTVASIGETRQRAAAERYRAQDTQRQIAGQLDALWVEREGQMEREQLARSRVANLTKVAQAGEAKFRKGLIGLDAMLDSQRRLTAAEIDAAQLGVQAALTDVQILITAGTFSPRMLSPN